MIVKRDGFYFTPLLTHGTYIKIDEEKIVQGMAPENYCELDEETERSLICKLCSLIAICKKKAV